MKKESAQVLQEISRQYGLDKYVRDEYTQLIFKEFRKYGAKLIKISNFEAMQKRGTILQQDIKDLISKKGQFQSHLASLQHALDLYASVSRTAPEPKVEVPKGISQETISTIATLLTLGKVANAGDRLDPDPLKTSSFDFQSLAELFKLLTTIQPSLETSIEMELNSAAETLRQLLNPEPSVSEPLGKQVSIAKIREEMMKICSDNILCQSKFKLVPKKAAPPPGLVPEPKKEGKDVGVSTLGTLIEEAEIPPDPAMAMPVSVLVPGMAEEAKSGGEAPKEIAPPQPEQKISPPPGVLPAPHKEEDQSDVVGESEDAEIHRRGRLPRTRGGYGRRPRGARRSDTRGYTYVKKDRPY